MKTFLCTVTAAALFLASSTSLSAQPSGFDQQFISPQQTTASINLKIPLGGSRTPAKPTYGVSVERGQTMLGTPGANADKSTVGDFRLGASGVETAKVGGYDFAATPTQLPAGTEYGLRGGYIIPIIALVAIILGVLAVSNNNDSKVRPCHPYCTD